MGRAVFAGVVAWVCVGFVAGCKERAPRTSEERAADALARVDQIAKVLPEIRRLSLDRPIPAARQSGAEFRGMVHQTIAEQPHLDHHAIALQSLGLIDPTTDFARSLENAYASQAAAYYDPRTKSLSLVMAPQDDTVFDNLSAHELTHGLQDQHFDLTTYLEGTKGAPLDADARIARRFVTEGDAMFTSVVYLVYSKTQEKELTGAQITAIRQQLAKLDGLDATAMAVSLKQQLATAKIEDPEIQRSLDAMPTIPPAILEPFLTPYMKGASLVAEAYERGRWAAVNKLFTDPPRSTSQVLHPLDHLFTPRVPPRILDLPSFDPEDLTLLESDVLGELMWGVYFRRWKHSGDPHPEVGWDGDRFAIWRDATGKTTVLISTAWDTTYDAKEFYDAYISTLAARYPDRKPGQGEQVRERIWVRIVDNQVLIADGPTTNVLDDVQRASAP